MTVTERRQFTAAAERNLPRLTTEQLESVVGYALDSRSHPGVYGHSDPVKNEAAYRAALLAVFRAAHATLPDGAVEDIFHLLTAYRARK